MYVYRDVSTGVSYTNVLFRRVELFCFAIIEKQQ